MQHGSHPCTCPAGRWILDRGLDPSQHEPPTAMVGPEDILSLPGVPKESLAEPVNSRYPKQQRKAVTNEEGMGGNSISKVFLGESQCRELLWWRLKAEIFTCLQGAGLELRCHHDLDHSRGVGGDTTAMLHTSSASAIMGIAKYCLERIANSSWLCSYPYHRQQGWRWDCIGLAKTWTSAICQSILPATQLDPGCLSRVGHPMKPWTPSMASFSCCKMHHGLPQFI